MSEETTTTPVQPDPAIAEMVGAVLDARDERMRQELQSTLAQAAAPQRSPVASLLPDSQRAESPSRVRVLEHSARSRRYRDLYRKSPDSIRTCRTEELDHWNHQWILGLLDKDLPRMQRAYDAANAAYLRQFGVDPLSAEAKADAEDPKGWEGPSRVGGFVGPDGIFHRATTLEGALDASDPTAILSGTGGSLLPQPFSQAAMIARERVAVIESLAMVYQMTSATLRIPTVGAATAAKRAEGGTIAQGEPTYASIMLKAENNSVYMLASREFIADSAFNAVSLFSERAGMALGANADVDFLTTNGTAPNASGQLDGTDDTADLAAATVLDFVDLSTIYRNVSQANRRLPGLAWLANTDVLTFFDTMVDGNGRPILNNPGATVQPVGDSPGNEGFVYRAPVFECPCTAGELIFGNIMQGYAVGRREGITARVSTEANFASGLVAFLVEERYDGTEVEPAAIRRYTGLASVS